MSTLTIPGVDKPVQTVVVIDGTTGLPASATSPTSTQITDGTNGPAAVKPASTAAVASDKALTVAVSPNGLNSNGRAAAASSAPTVQSNEDFNEIKRASAATKANVTGSITSGTILAQNVNRKQALIANDSTAILYIDLTGGTASSTSYSVALAAAVSGVPSVFSISNFTGLITGVWATANGAARVTELT